MKALFYNWVPFDVTGEGGGVSVYLRQLLPRLANQHGWEVSFLSSGYNYDLLNRKCRYQKTKNTLERYGIRSFEIVNSPVKAPAHDMIAVLEEGLANDVVASEFLHMVSETGPYDVIILHNIEGISTLTLEKLDAETDAAIILFLHNYHIVCPQIELLRDSKSHCIDYHDGKDCIGCFGVVHDTKKLMNARAVLGVIDRFKLSGTSMGEIVRSTVLHVYGWSRDIFSVVRSSRDKAKHRSASRRERESTRWRSSLKDLDDRLEMLAARSDMFRKWRELNTHRAHHCATSIITVSDRARQQLVQRGLNSSEIDVMHLGFDHYVSVEERLARFDARAREEGNLRLGFFGYPIPSKGLGFLIAALEKAGPWVKGTELFIFARYDDLLYRRLSRLEGKLAAIHWIDGYRQTDLVDIASSIDCAVIPSIWYETYSITAYELAMAGVPVLLSDSVGFGEMIGDRRFTFRRGDEASFLETLSYFVCHRNELRDFFLCSDVIPSLEEHLRSFLAHILKATAARKKTSFERNELDSLNGSPGAVPTSDFD